MEHYQSAHCENGVVTSLLRDQGLDFMNEPLAFGLGSGIFYVHLPFLKINNAPAIAFRIMPGNILKSTSRALGIKVVRKKFSNSDSARVFLDKKIEEGTLVGCQVGVFNLPYFPREYRFHFNAHNVIISGFENGKYIVSDPIMETITSLTPDQLDNVRFARGPLAPKGLIYYPEKVKPVSTEQLQKAIKKSIVKTTWWMTQIPSHHIGARGLKHTANQIRKWRGKLGEKTAGLYLGQIVRMQEEIGTGGGGFRFIYAAFLEQASAIIENDKLLHFSDLITKSGDLMRENAVKMAGIYKGRTTEQKHFDEVADLMTEISQLELNAFRKLRKLKL